MPTYQYACTACGERLEVVQKFSDDPLSVCPACQGRLRKLFSSVGVVFKGSGFYKTDSRGSSGPKPAGESKPAAGESKPAVGESKPAGGESKPAGKGSSAGSGGGDSKVA